MKITSSHNSLWQDLKRFKIAKTALVLINCLASLITINAIVKMLPWTYTIIIGLVIFLVICLYLLYKIYDNNMNDNNKEEFGQIILKHDTFNNWQNQIILHAAFYPNYINPPYKDAIDDLLANEDKLKVKITVIITHPNVKWADEFQKILRNNFSDIEKDFKGAIWESSKFFLDKKQKNNDRIKIILSKRLPLFPVVIIDNELFIGHYCHTAIPAPEGFWFYYKNDVIHKLINYFIGNSNDSDFKKVISSDPKLKALSRYIEDINDAITKGKEINNIEDLMTEMNFNNPNENTEKK